MDFKLTTTQPYKPGAGALVGGPLDGVEKPPLTSWSILVTEDGQTYYIYERRTPNDPRYYFKSVYPKENA